MKNLFRIAFAASATALAAASYAAEPIVIGVSIAQSPPGSVVQGTQVKDGVEIVVKMLNDKGGVLGRPLKVVYEDNQGIPEKGRAATEKLITRDKVVAITGEHQSSAALAGMEVAHRYHIPYINTNGWSDAIREKGYAEVFNPGNYNNRVGDAVAEAMKALGAKRVVAFAENTDFGIGLAKIIAAKIKERASQVDYKFETLDRASKDFLPALLPLRANPPDAVTPGGSARESPRVYAAPFRCNPSVKVRMCRSPGVAESVRASSSPIASHPPFAAPVRSSTRTLPRSNDIPITTTWPSMTASPSIRNPPEQ